MYLRKNKGAYELVQAIRQGGRPRTKFICYIGKLSELEKLKWGLILKLKNSGDHPILTPCLTSKNEFKPPIKIVREIPIRPNTYKKVIDKDWLKNAYLVERLSISAIAQMLAIHRDRVRENLEEIGMIKDKRATAYKSRDTHPEFGWTVVAGKKVRDLVELEIINQMARWRSAQISFQEIADKLTALGIKGKLGAGKWDRGVVRRILIRNQKYLEDATALS